MKNLFFFILLSSVSAICQKQKVAEQQPKIIENQRVSAVEKPKIKVAAERLEAYLPKIEGKRIALVVNQTSTVGKAHLADTLLRRGIQIQKIFAPEHGFRGTADAGETVKNGRDTRTGLPIISLYGKNKKPSAADLADVDVVVFDIQDVGARFYTYISTLFYVQQACAEFGKKLLLLDRPTPNGHFVDGPVLKEGYESFIGIAPLPVVHGCTVGEIARIFAGENWLKISQTLDLEIVACENYDHHSFYELPIAPSPNLPTMRSIYLYPSLCFFEGTVASVGRGTDSPFEVVGHPDFPQRDFSFVPKPNLGNAAPLLEGKTCFGFNFQNEKLDVLRQRGRIDLKPLLDFFHAFPDRDGFFLKNKFFDKLAGSAALREQILAGKTEAEIRESWAGDLEKFRSIRKKYLLYD